MESLKRYLHRVFSLTEDTASYELIEDRIISGGQVRGTNLCILMLAIIIASIGLNMNSTAVIIGAMLISPLMGSIMAIGYGLATADIRQARNSFVGFLFQVTVCLITSTLYFKISPISTACSELLARTNPTVWDVLIAVCGGTAGIIGTTRKERSNVLPGVAIATALMPPLCTAGYGIAMRSLHYFLGAMYLFLINTYFICFTSTVLLIILNVPVKNKINIPAKALRSLHRKLLFITAVVTIPSIILGYRVVRSTIDENNGHIFENEDTYNTEKFTKELQVIYPEIDTYKIGSIDSVDDESGKVETKLTAMITVSRKMSDEKKATLKALVKLETGADDVNIYED